jgi:glycosyltransferase involved in cell wall biosynthesis
MTIVTVIVPTRNRSLLLRQTLSSIRNVEGNDIAIDLVVIDDGSLDDTEDVAKQFQASFFRTNQPGASNARNEGLRYAKGEFVNLTDDDDVWTAEHLRPHIDLMRRRPELNAVIGQVINVDEHLEGGGEPWPHDLPSSGNLLSRFFQFHPQIGATVLRTRCVQDLKFDPLLAGSEDWDWHIRLAEKNKIGFVTVPCLLFRQRPVGSDDELLWERICLFDRVLVRNARRNLLRVSPLVFLLSYVKHHGQFAFRFSESFKAHAIQHDRAKARRALKYALLTSPLHIARLSLSDAALRKAIAGMKDTIQPL